MTCAICQNEIGNKNIELKEMMFGLQHKFNYLECAVCGCLQIVSPPADMSAYYPKDYYSFTAKTKLKKKHFLKRLRSQYIIGGKKTWIGKLMAANYKAPVFYDYLKNLKLFDYSTSILDVGSGNGNLLKKFYRLGYKDLTGTDPFIESDIIYNGHLRIEKKTIFDIKRRYDVIMMHHSLEHMDQQLAVLKKLKDILTEDGKLLIRIPILSKPLIDKYDLNVVSLDAPRHYYIHTFKSISILLEKAGLKIDKYVYDADEISFWGSEQYQKGISLYNNQESQYEKKAFTDEQMEVFRKEIQKLNDQEQSDNIALYVSKK